MLVFAMAGLSRRFTEAGYTQPKFMLPVGGHTAFDYSVAGFIGGFAPGEFTFIYRETGGVRAFLDARLAALGLGEARLAELEAPTAGQADTVAQGLRKLGGDAGEELAIFNIDTFRTNFRRPGSAMRGDGYLEVFRGTGDNWSYVGPTPEPGSNGVLRTTEKQPISDLCCTGLYTFRSVADYLWAVEEEVRAPTTHLKEVYVAPIYNHLIRRGADIRYDVVERGDVIFCGVPAEYEALRDDATPLAPLAGRLER